MSTASTHTDIFKWILTYLTPEVYKIRNVEFGDAFASYNPQPQAKDGVVGRWRPKQWIIKSTEGDNVYTFVIEFFDTIMIDNNLVFHPLGTQIYFGMRQMTSMELRYISSELLTSCLSKKDRSYLTPV